MDDAKAEAVAAEILKLPITDMIWPNCLVRAIYHSVLVDVDNIYVKLAKSVVGKEIASSESRATKSLLTKDKGKKVEVAHIETRIDDISTDWSGTPVGLKLSNSKSQFAQGITHFLSVLFLLILVRTLFLLPCAEYKAPVIRKLELFGRELFLKRGSESGSDVSRNIGVSTSPTPKKAKVIVPPSPPHVTKDDHPFEAPTE